MTYPVFELVPFSTVAFKFPLWFSAQAKILET